MKKRPDSGMKIKNMFGNNLKRFRDIENKSQVKLASETGLSHNFINNIENGRKWVSAETIGILASALKVEPHQFFIAGSEWETNAAENFSLCLDDFSNSVAEQIKEIRLRYLSDNDQNNRKM